MEKQIESKIIKVKPYLEYKDSGEAWIAEIPKHWEIKKLKLIFSEKKLKTNPALNCGSISYGKVVVKNDEKIPISTKASYQEVLRGEFLINPLNLNYDLISLRIALSNIDVVVSSGYIVLNAIINMDKEYFKYLLHRYDVAYMKLLGSGVRQTINFNHISNSLLPFPPIKEQIAIGKFLSSKTALIDNAIGIKERQIELLKERRQILIHNAVTRGINPDVKMKDSGVDWLGEIPSHWKVKRLKYVFRIIKRIAGELGHSVLSITQNGIKIKDIESGEGQLSMDYSKYQLVYKGDFAMNHMDLLTGFVDISEFDGVMSPDYRVFNLIDSENDKKYMLFLLQVGYKSKVFFAHGQGVSMLGRWRFPTENFNVFQFPIPPLSEQIAVTEFIEKATGKTTKAISLKEQEIEKLKEYKATLINSAVTGKIKVTA